MNGAVRINAMDTFGHDGGFCSSDGSRKGGKLPVNIADAHFVHIDQCECANPGSGECFDSPGADTTYSNDTHMRPTKPFRSGLAVEALDTVKSGVIIALFAHSGEL